MRCLHGYTAKLCPYCKHKLQNPQQLMLVARPMTWEKVGVWFDAEGTFPTPRIVNGKLEILVAVSQKNARTSGLRILQQIRDFIQTETGIKGFIYQMRPNQYQLAYYRLPDIYELTFILEPLIQRLDKKQAITRIRTTIENHIQTQLFKYRSLSRTHPHIGYYKTLEKRYQKLNQKLRQIKQKYT